MKKAIALLLAFLPSLLSADTLKIGYLELKNDDRYDRGRMAERIQGQPWGRPWDAVQVAQEEARFALNTRDISLGFERITADNQADLVERAQHLHEQGVHLFLLDLPAAALLDVARALPQEDVLLINVSSRSASLRQDQCQANLLHTAPSHAMLSDGLAQYLVFQKWGRVLVLKGPAERDEALYLEFIRASKRFGLQITGVRPFVAGTDPRQRERNNLRLLTRGSDFDVIYVADADGEFARTLPYATLAPRVVVGSAGLVPGVWHWNWRRHGAPQLNNRFREATGRDMTGNDWPAWAAVKALAEALMRVQDQNVVALAQYLRSDAFVLDGFQGYPLSFRPWNGQLRAAVLLGTPDWVAARAPFEGFLHARNDLDSLGIDKQEARCGRGAPTGREVD